MNRTPASTMLPGHGPEAILKALADGGALTRRELFYAAGINANTFAKTMGYLAEAGHIRTAVLITPEGREALRRHEARQALSGW